MITDTDVLFLVCILLAMVCAALAWYAWQEHMQAIAQRIRAEEQAMWADHFQAAADQCAAENARLRRLLTKRLPIPPPSTVLALPWHTVSPDEFSRN